MLLNRSCIYTGRNLTNSSQYLLEKSDYHRLHQALRKISNPGTINFTVAVFGGRLSLLDFFFSSFVYICISDHLSQLHENIYWNLIRCVTIYANSLTLGHFPSASFSYPLHNNSGYTNKGTACEVS